MSVTIDPASLDFLSNDCFCNCKPSTQLNSSSDEQSSFTQVIEELIRNPSPEIINRRREYEWSVARNCLIDSMGSKGLEVLAIGMRIGCPDMTVPEIAEIVGVHRGTACRWPTFNSLREKLKNGGRDIFQSNLPSGSKSEDGIEAWLDEEDPQILAVEKAFSE